MSCLFRQCGRRSGRVKPEDSMKPPLDSFGSIVTEVDDSHDQRIVKAGNYEGSVNNNDLGIVTAVFLCFFILSPGQP